MLCNNGSAMKSLIQQISRPVQNYSLPIIIKSEGKDSEIGNGLAVSES